MNTLYTLMDTLRSIIHTSETAITDIRKQHFWKTAFHIKELIFYFTQLFNNCSTLLNQQSISLLNSYLGKMLDAQNIPDYVLLGDILDLELLPCLYELQASVLAELEFPYENYFSQNMQALKQSGKAGEQLCRLLETHDFSNPDKTVYQPEPSGIGAFTLKKNFSGGSIYFHSNKNPWMEGYHFAESYAEEGMFHYAIIGLGLGYHALFMFLKDRRYRITVLEPDLNIIGLAMQMVDFSYALTEERFQIIYSPSLSELDSLVKESDCKVLIHYPTMQSMENHAVKNVLTEYFLQMSSVEEQLQSLSENFYYNIRRNDLPADSLKYRISGKPVVYLGGGPGSETHLPEIIKYKALHPDTITICAGKIYRMLLSQNFVPDYVIITDAKPSLAWQLRDLPQTAAELLYLSTASNSAVDTFCGKKYIFFQKDFAESEDFAREHSLLLFETGGSVSTATIDFALRMGCSTLITTGLDLAYPEKKSHAFGISGNISDTHHYISEKDIHGNKILTTATFLSYRKWIEKRLVKSGTECINLTDGLAIKGMKNLDHLDYSSI